MLKRVFIYSVFSLAGLSAWAQPSFNLVGYATMNGGTTGGAAGTTVTATNLSELTSYLTSSTAYVIEIGTTISGGTAGARINVNSNKTLLGLGSTAFLQGVGLNISSKSNIIIRNVKFTMSTVTQTYINDENRPQVAANDGDCITIQGTSSNIWIDHCEFYNADPATQTNQDLYDGLIDAKNGSAFITISWCYFHDHHKCHLIGSSDSDNFDRKITFHHNYYKNIKERLPSYRFGTGHVFNNYYEDVSSSGVNSRMGACLKVEKNYFEDTKDPVTTKNSSTNGNWDVSDNFYTSCTGSQPTTSTCSLTIPYTYSNVLTTTTTSVKTVVTTYAGVGKLDMASPTATLAPQQANTLWVYPNPFSQQVTLQAEGSFTYAITNNEGRVMAHGWAVDSAELPTETFANGLYVVTITQENTTKQFKLMKTE